MPKALAWRVEIDVKSIANQIDKEITNLRRNTGLEGKLINTAVSKNRQTLLFPLLDNGTKAHVIDPGPSGYLANTDNGFIVRGPVEHPGSPPHDISARTLSYFEGVLQRAVAGTSTRALLNRTGAVIDYDLIRQTFTRALLSAKNYAESITPANWGSVKESFELRINNRKVE